MAQQITASLSCEKINNSDVTNCHSTPGSTTQPPLAYCTNPDLPLFVLQCDQQKGFDMLEPQGFYDAIQAYHLPESIIALDRSAQSRVPYQVKTAYWFTDMFIVDGVTKQGGSLSLLKCTLTTSLLTHWINDLSSHNSALLIQTHQKHVGRPHVVSDNLCLSLPMLEAMDDSLLFNGSWPNLCCNARLADAFQTAYGWETAWKKSMLYMFNTDLDPPGQPSALIPSMLNSDPSSKTTI